MKKKILFLLHFPPPIHGSSIMGQEIKESNYINNSFDCRYINMLVNQNINESGKIGIIKGIQFIPTLFQLISETIKNRPDVCYLALTTTGIGLYKDALVVAMLRLFGIKRVYHLHNKGIIENSKIKFNNFIYRYIFKDADIILLSNHLYNDIEAYVPTSRVHICPNGIGNSDYSVIKTYRFKHEEPVQLLFFSNLIESKGVYVLLEACKLLINRNNNFICRFAGSIGNVSEQDFNLKVQQFGLENNVRYLGPQYENDKEIVFQNADIFVHPTYNDCFPLVLIEAMQYSLPIVSTDEGGIPEMLTNGVSGFLVPQKDAEKLSEKIELLIQNPTLRLKMGKAGRLKYEAEFTKATFENKMHAILQNIISIENNSMKIIETIGFNVFSDNLATIPIQGEKCRVINTISPNSYGISTKDLEFENALKSSDFLVLDGVYFGLSSLIINKKNIKKNQGPDVFYHFIERINTQKGSAFFFGSTENTLQKIKSRARIEYPNIDVNFFSPPFKTEFTDLENELIIKRINAVKPDILFVGMTCPKQEKWALKHRDKLNVGLIICIGNVFDWFAGTQKPIPAFWYKIRLGWLARIFMRPEIFKRNIGNQMVFLWHVILIFLKIKKV